MGERLVENDFANFRKTIKSQITSHIYSFRNGLIYLNPDFRKSFKESISINQIGILLKNELIITFHKTTDNFNVNHTEIFTFENIAVLLQLAGFKIDGNTIKNIVKAYSANFSKKSGLFEARSFLTEGGGIYIDREITRYICTLFALCSEDEKVVFPETINHIILLFAEEVETEDYPENFAKNKDGKYYKYSTKSKRFFFTEILIIQHMFLKYKKEVYTNLHPNKGFLECIDRFGNTYQIEYEIIMKATPNTYEFIINDPFSPWKYPDSIIITKSPSGKTQLLDTVLNNWYSAEKQSIKDAVVKKGDDFIYVIN